MKPFLCFSFLSFCFANIAAAQACTVSTDTAHLDVNNARVILQASGDFFWDRNDAGFFVPKGDPSQPQTATIFAGGLWLGGFDPGGNLKVAAQTYGANGGSSDYWPGPLNNQGTTNANICSDFNKLWKVIRSETNAHIVDFASDGVIDGPVPQSILKWPGRDNPQSLAANGFALPSGQELAPFVDRNSNGKYEPLKGDYPNVNGDQAIWWVFNDEGGGAIHGVTHGLPIQIEIHALAYGFEGQGGEDLANTTFYDFNIFNRALEDLDSVYVGLWLDTDIGCSSDNYVGCISSEKMAFAYNGDNIDGDQNCNCSNFGVASFCQDIPATAIKVLQGPTGTAGNGVGFSSFTFAVNQIGGAVPWLSLSPYFSMTGVWPDGYPITYGGSGYDTLSTNYHPFLMDGNPGNSDDWTFCSENYASGDFRMLIGSGPFNLAPGENTSITYAILNKFGLQYPCPELSPLIEMGDAIQTYFDDLTPTQTPISASSSVHFYPNPLISEGKLTTSGAVLEAVRLFSLDGRIIGEYKNLNSNELTILRGGLPAGFYLYSALLNNGQFATGKIVAQ
ncbi:MAG: T9SS type A sorting domain-containing protein [Saprospiraceae bacterium]|nr:T9SS type A sorting domain-containing protein [Saprospiraceae bacterium]MCF8249082.1 T9SS type A sorting domain-containing protein [Saprospiraceae bacterium]MCF8280949.1 T9SS type A sorting domain-containing protein [Bacteroidales bacterium]MCF8311104.1 T9SS type A sorting domain-containing protein [Saprospiraceae bacterium]MCF8440194.1 T9SS type A sorting domain-containing protein [Saprospiraceae bacterium]